MNNSNIPCVQEQLFVFVAELTLYCTAARSAFATPLPSPFFRDSREVIAMSVLLWIVSCELRGWSIDDGVDVSENVVSRVMLGHAGPFCLFWCLCLRAVSVSFVQTVLPRLLYSWLPCCRWPSVLAHRTFCERVYIP